MTTNHQVNATKILFRRQSDDLLSGSIHAHSSTIKLSKVLKSLDINGTGAKLYVFAQGNDEICSSYENEAQKARRFKTILIPDNEYSHTVYDDISN